ncbi:MAG: desulfoferrodoxin [Nanoarchaeota archaeon]|nr:desulfoferrodoxin [Nanoarchaeota archaeon]
MTEIDGVYKCEICGNIVTVIESGAGALVCCGQEMKLLKEYKKEDEGEEKHVPVVSVDGNKATVKVGSAPHPMEEKHYIELVQLMKDGKVIVTRRLGPEDKPEAEFCLDNAEGVTARIFCNVHGLWVN